MGQRLHVGPSLKRSQAGSKRTKFSMLHGKKPRGIMFYPDFAKRTLDRRAKRIPELMEHRKNGRIAYFVKDKVVVKVDKTTCSIE